MRVLSFQECDLPAGTDSAGFNQCMAANWGNNTVVGGVSGAIAGGVAGGGVLSLHGAIAGGILGVVGGSTGTGIFCGFKAIF